MMKEKKKDTFFQKFIDSIKNIEKYPELAIKSFGEVLLYILKLMLIFTTFVSFAYMYKVSKELKQIYSFVYDEVPDFKLQDGKLLVIDSTPFIRENITENLNIVIIDTNNNLEDETLKKYKNDLLNKENGIIVLNNRFLIKTMTTNGILEYNNSQILENANIGDLSKNDIMNYFSGKKVILIFVAIYLSIFIYMFIFYNVSIIFDVILLTLLGYISTLFMRIRIRFNALCKIAIHSLTLPIVLNLIVILIELFTPFKIKYFEIMYLVIAFIYIVAVISIIRIDIIKNKQELLNIMEEQKRVKEELDRQEEEKRKEKKQEKKNDEDDKKQDKKDQNDTPQGEGT